MQIMNLKDVYGIRVETRQWIYHASITLFKLFKLSLKSTLKLNLKFFLIINETSALRKKCLDYTNKTYLYDRMHFGEIKQNFFFIIMIILDIL